MKLLVLLNDRARDGASEAVLAQLEKTFFRHALRIERPASIGEAQALLRAATDVDVAVVAGGDGTVNVALQALAGGSVPLGVLPLGTANDLADEVDLPQDLAHACEVIKLKRCKELDVIAVRSVGLGVDGGGSKASAERLFVTSGGTGLAADVAVDTNRFKTAMARIPGVRDVVRSLGKELYQLFLVKEFVFPAEHVRRLHLTWDDNRATGGREVETALIMINNQAVVGGSFVIAPQTRNDDGRFCVSVFLDQEGPALAKTTSLLRQGRSPGPQSILQIETTKLTLTAVDGKPVRFFGDGELLADTDASLELFVRPRAARVIVP